MISRAELRDTTPIDNIIQEDAGLVDRYLQEFLEFSRKVKPKVAHHKAKMGPQSYTFVGSEFRFWVWDRPTYRVFVSDKKGVCFEVPPEFTAQEAFAAWKLYLKDVGAPPLRCK